MPEKETNTKPSKFKGRQMSPANLEKIQRLLDEFLMTNKKGNWDTYWKINDLIIIAYGDDYITEKKQLKTRQFLSRVKKILRQHHNLILYNVSGKGYRLWPAFDKLPKQFQDGATDDALTVFETWFSYAQRLFAPNGILRTMSERGRIELSGDTMKKIGETRLLLKAFEEKKL